MGATIKKLTLSNNTFEVKAEPYNFYGEIIPFQFYVNGNFEFATRVPSIHSCINDYYAH